MLRKKAIFIVNILMLRKKAIVIVNILIKQD